MRSFKWSIVVGLAALTTGCVETLDTGYSRPSYGYSSGYYTPYRPTQTVVVTQTRYVAVPVATTGYRPYRYHHHDGRS